MISCHIKHLESRCRQRGYTLDEVRACIVSQDGDQITVDETHAAYPREPRVTAPAPRTVSRPPGVPPQRLAEAIAQGPGTELKKLLAAWPWRIKSTPTCPCNRMAKKMDEWGPDECEKPERIAEVLSFMEPEARKRKLVWSETAARAAIKIAIWRARRAERRAQTLSRNP